MALSIVTWRGERDGHQEFEAEIGSNRFYAWGVGSGVRKHDGVRILASRARTSPLAGPVEQGSHGRVLLRVPSDSFTADDHHLQLLSFRDEDLRGPAVSDIVEVPWRWARPADRRAGRGTGRGEENSMSTLSLPPRAFGAAHAVSARPSYLAPSQPVGHVPPGPRMSHAQFLDALAGLISQVLPVVRQALPVVEQALPVVQQIGKLVSGAAPPATPPAGAGAPAGGTTGTAARSPDLGQLLTQLLAQVQQAAAPVAAPPSPPAQTTTQAPADPAAAEAARAGTESLSMSAGHRYSYASIAPLLAALPALAPMLQSVLSPQTVQSLISAGDPNRLLQTTIAGLMDAARIGQQATDALHAHLRALNPGLGDDVLIPLLAAMSTTASHHDRTPRHTLSRLVRLELADLAPVELGGYPQVAFRQGEDITLPVSVRTPRAIPRPRLHVCIKDPRTHRRVAERSWSFDRLEQGRLPEPVVLPAAVTHRLTAGQEYYVALRLTWPGRDGLMAATTAQLVRVVGEAVFDSMDTGGPPVRLDDVDRDRDWWHRVWTDTVDERGSRVKARLEYEYTVVAEGSGNLRADTDVNLQDVTGRRAEGTLRSGLEVSLASLSRLAQRMAGDSFDDATMRALADPGFAEAFDRVATCSVDLHARRGARVAIWVWPEVKLHQVFLRRPADVSPTTGQVLTFDTSPVKVPVPALAHVVTTRSA
jgi:hypothetical protein